ncbi:MAG: ABC transporter permease [Bacillota bacterium]
MERVTEMADAQLQTKPHHTVGTNRIINFLQEIKKNWVLFLMMLPALAVLFINNYLPMSGMVVAFKDINYSKGIWGSDWLWFKNFEYLFKSNSAWIITRNVILYNMVFIIISITIAVALAIILNELLNRKIAKLYQSIMFFPYFLSWVVVSYLVFACLSSDMGYFNAILSRLGLESVQWYMETKLWPWIIVAVNTWKWTGYDSIIYLATIIGFDKAYYEAAAVDGATRWQQITKITIPMLKPVIIVLTLLKVGRMFYTDIGLFYNVPRNMGILQDVTNTIDTYVFRALRSTGDIGMAAAAGFYQAIVGLSLVLIANYIVRKIDKDSALF